MIFTAPLYYVLDTILSTYSVLTHLILTNPLTSRHDYLCFTRQLKHRKVK